MKKLMILLAAMAMSTLALQANEAPAPSETGITSTDIEVAAPAEDKNETAKVETPAS